MQIPEQSTEGTLGNNSCEGKGEGTGLGRAAAIRAQFRAGEVPASPGEAETA